MGKEVGGAFRMGNTCTPVADSCQCLAKPTDFPVAQTVKNLPVTQETRVRSLDCEVPLEKGMEIHSSILAWRIPWTEKPGGRQSMGRKELDMTEQLTHIIHTWQKPPQYCN